MEGNRGRVFRSGPQRSRRTLQASKSKIAEQCRNGHADQEKVLISNEPPVSVRKSRIGSTEDDGSAEESTSHGWVQGATWVWSNR